MRWNEETIRQEIRRLDAKTGLSGSKLPIRFRNAKSYLGLYYTTKEKGFCFSTYYFENPDFQVESALDVIRHEYAHFMNDIIYNGGCHDATWKKCCEIVGARPLRCYSKDCNEYFRKKRQREIGNNEKLDLYKVGQRILHPRFGNGVIEKIERTGNSFLADVNFDLGFKRLSFEWIDENCDTKVKLR